METPDKNETKKRIREALKKRSGKSWSVTSDTGTASGWIKIASPPKRCINGYMSDADRAELSALMGLKYVHRQGHNIPASNDFYVEHIDRAEGREPRVIGKIYWE